MLSVSPALHFIAVDEQLPGLAGVPAVINFDQMFPAFDLDRPCSVHVCVPERAKLAEFVSRRPRYATCAEFAVYF